MSQGVQLLSQGAEGRLYTSVWLGREVVIKQRFSKKYRHPDLDTHITRERIKAEARALVRCRMIGIDVPVLYDVNFHSSELVLEYLSKTISVRKAINDRGPDWASLPHLADVIGRILAKLHSNDIIHGDLTTSNMLLLLPLPEGASSENLVVYMIDFGLSCVSEQSEDKAVDLYVLERAVLSTHPNSDEFLKRILDVYKEEGGKRAGNVITRLDDVRLRGRKKLCFG